MELRRKYESTYFDSLHASAAIMGDGTLVSYDRAYLHVRGLKYLPHKRR